MTAEKKGMSKGCLVALIIGGALAIIVIALGIVCYVYQDEILQWSLEKTTDIIAQEIKTNLPEGTTEEEVDNLIDKFKTAVKEKKIDAPQMQHIATLFQQMLEDKKIDQDESQKLLEEIKKVVGE